MELNSLMSISEAGVVLGVVLEGAEHIPRYAEDGPSSKN